MKMMDELRPLFLYPKTMKVHAPVNEKDKKKGASIMLLTKDTTTSSKLMRLPYLHNPNLFSAYYIDRNAMAYIDNVGIENIDFDEKEAEAISEGIIFSSIGKTKFDIDDKATIMDTRRIKEILNQSEIETFAKGIRFTRVPEHIKVVVYPNVSALRNAAPKNIQNVYGDFLYSFVTDTAIHVLSYAYYDEELMGGNYIVYLRKALYQYLIEFYNNDIPTTMSHVIASGLSGQSNWIGENRSRNRYNLGELKKLAEQIGEMERKKAWDLTREYIKHNDVNIFRRYQFNQFLGVAKKLIFESSLTYMQRERLLPSEFGIPNKRKYPMHDEEHVRLALKMFNNADEDEEEELANNIVKKAKYFGITDLKASAANRFRKFYDPVTLKPADEAKLSKDDQKKKSEKDDKQAINESGPIGTDYLDIVKICNRLGADELSRITFYDTYRDSNFVAKRIIKRVGPEPAGFLDAYIFPSNPDIAQIVIAVDPRFRSQHIADDMVDELVNGDFSKTHEFKMFYWTAHPDNEASQSLAMKHGFMDTGYMDKYGRKVFIKKVNEDDNIWKEIPSHMKPTHSSEEIVETALSFATNDMALLTESPDKEYSMRLKKYLYAERIKNNREAALLYERIKESNPEIKKTYIKLEMYRNFNLFVDLSYYHGLFLKNNATKLDKAVNFYFEFINRLIDNSEVNATYKKQTIFIPVDLSAWDVSNVDDLTDYKRSLNPISIICRLVRTNPEALRKAWGNKSIAFVGTRGYFIVDFKDFDIKKLSRFKTNLKKLTSDTEVIVDDYEVDPDVLSGNDKDTPKARAAKMIDKIESGSGIKIDNIEKIDVPVQPIQHLAMKTGVLDIDPSSAGSINGIAIVALDVDDKHEALANTVFNKVKGIDTFCLPNK